MTIELMCSLPSQPFLRALFSVHCMESYKRLRKPKSYQIVFERAHNCSHRMHDFGSKPAHSLFCQPLNHEGTMSIQHAESCAGQLYSVSHTILKACQRRQLFLNNNFLQILAGARQLGHIMQRLKSQLSRQPSHWSRGSGGTDPDPIGSELGFDPNGIERAASLADMRPPELLAFPPAGAESSSAAESTGGHNMYVFLCLLCMLIAFLALLNVSGVDFMKHSSSIGLRRLSNDRLIKRLFKAHANAAVHSHAIACHSIISLA